jgi:hypothetical protein
MAEPFDPRAFSNSPFLQPTRTPTDPDRRIDVRPRQKKTPGTGVPGAFVGATRVISWSHALPLAGSHGLPGKRH